MINYRTQDFTNRSLIYKKDNLEIDACLIHVLRILHEIIEDEYSLSSPPNQDDLIENRTGKPKNNEMSSYFPLVTYDVLPLTTQSGFIEVVPDSQTVSAILEETTLTNYLLSNNPEVSVGQLIDRYTHSLAFWTVMTYVFGIGDRHLDNIMIRKDGILFHIDYGVFGNDPKRYVSPIRLDNRMIETVGGKPKYEQFKRICEDILLIIRKHYPLIYCLLRRFGTVQKNFDLKEYLINILFIGHTDNEARTAISSIID